MPPPRDSIYPYYKEVTMLLNRNTLTIETKNVIEGYVNCIQQFYEIPRIHYPHYRQGESRYLPDGTLCTRRPRTFLKKYAATPMGAQRKSTPVTVNTATVQEPDGMQVEEGTEAADVKEENGPPGDSIAAERNADQHQNDTMDNLVDVIKDIRVD